MLFVKTEIKLAKPGLLSVLCLLLDPVQSLKVTHHTFIKPGEEHNNLCANLYEVEHP